MREILFRGKRKDNDQWVQGSLFAECSRFEIVRGTCNNVGIEGVDVIPETVGQYTGLTANGKKIFEGDVVKRCNDNCVVKWVEEDAEFGIFGGMTKLSFSLIFSDKLEIIGNIHDNPELLGDK